jgi:sugar phosphate isomerase/epimerase
MKLGMDTFSLRWQGWDAFRLLDYAARLGLDTVHFSERKLLGGLAEGFLNALRRRAEELGLSVEIGMLSFDRFAGAFDPSLGSGEQQLMDMARAARIVGSPVVRCVLGFQADRLGPVPFAQHVDECVRALRAAGPVASDHGVRFAIENHGGVDLLARELRALIEAAGTDIAGACLDTGNPAYGGEDPVLSAEVLGPLIVSSHVRDTRVWGVEDGAMAQWVPAGQGDTDLPRVVEIMAAQAPAAPVDLEIITGGAPKHIPYLDPAAEYWTMYPDMPARDFARFVALAERGRPRPLDQLVMPRGPGAPPDQALRAQQRRHFEASVAYCKNVLRIGERSARRVTKGGP